MSITRVLQPYVCCLGNPVAGNPTQFVMYRAARNSGADWRFFTSQVAVDQFEIAFRGVQALGLDGVAILDPFQETAIPLLESVTESALSLGRVNVARSDGNSWLGDNTLGTAICNCIEAKTTPQGSIAPVIVIGNPQVAKAVRLASPLFSQATIALQYSNANGSTTNKTPAITQESDTVAETQPHAASDTLSSETLDDYCDRDGRVGSLVFCELPTPAQLKRLIPLKQVENACCILLGSHSEKQLRPIREWLTTKSIRFVEPVDFMAFQSAADFHFWTGIWPSVEQIRDSLEEYLQW